MTPALVTVRCRKDNYAYLVHLDGRTVLFDAPEAAPILAALRERDWPLTDIALTHHHDDHVDGVAEIVTATGASVTGARTDAGRLPPLDRAVDPGATVSLAGMEARVIDVSGHTIGHVAYHLPQAGIAATGDSLMALGCGRLFEGTAAMMWASLSRLAALPDETLICSGHDYCASNGAFARMVDPDNPALEARLQAVLAGSRPCAPASLAEEKATNPFLRAPVLARAGETAEAAFARLRLLKDNA